MHICIRNIQEARSLKKKKRKNQHRDATRQDFSLRSHARVISRAARASARITSCTSAKSEIRARASFVTQARVMYLSWRASERRTDALHCRQRGQRLYYTTGLERCGLCILMCGCGRWVWMSVGRVDAGGWNFEV